MVTLYGGVSCKSINNNNNHNQITNTNNNNNNNNENNDYASHHNSNNNTITQKKQNCLQKIFIFTIWTILTLTSVTVTVQGAAVYSNADFLANPNFEPICSAQQEHFIESDGKESSLILEFNPGVLAEKKKSCTRILSAPSNYGFIVRLILPKIRRNRQLPNTDNSKAKPAAMTATKSAAALNEMTSFIDKINSTALKNVLGRTCPLNIFSSLDPHTPQWRVDPCQLEDTAPEMEDPVRLFHGRVRIVWEHGNNMLHSKLMVTALGKGDQCRSENKHQCLKIGDEPILCISKDLICDGIRHCPYSNEYDSDEDYAMCWKRRRYDEPMPPAMESDIFEHFALEVFRNLFAFDVSTMSTKKHTTTTEASNAAGVNSTTLRKVNTAQMTEGNINTTSVNRMAVNTTTPPMKAENTTESGHHRRNSTRNGMNSDLSKYGPWGYLMLGMLLCGGALLICGLWASASQHAVNNEREAALQNAGFNGSSIDNHSSGTSPPTYDELDPPPAYSVLFPNQKAASSTTLSSLNAAATSPGSTQLLPVAAASSGTIIMPAMLATTLCSQNESATSSNAIQLTRPQVANV